MGNRKTFFDKLTGNKFCKLYKMEKALIFFLVALIFALSQITNATIDYNYQTGPELDNRAQNYYKRIKHHKIGALVTALFKCKNIGEVCSLDNECCSNDCCIDLCEHFCC